MRSLYLVKFFILFFLFCYFIMSLIPHSRRLMSVSQLASAICSTTPAFSTLNASSAIIVASNPADLNQLVAEGYQYVFVYDIALTDLVAGNAGAARVVSQPIYDFLYDVNNFSSYTSLNSLANGEANGNLPVTNLQSSVVLSKLISDPTYGGIHALNQIISDCLANNFQFSTPFCPHIFSSSYSVLNPLTGLPTPINTLVYAILDNNGRVLLFGTSFTA